MHKSRHPDAPGTSSNRSPGDELRSPRNKVARSLARTVLASPGASKIGRVIVAPWRPDCDAPVARFVATNPREGAPGDPPLEVLGTFPCRRCAKCSRFRSLQWGQRNLWEIARALAGGHRVRLVTFTVNDANLADLRMRAHKRMKQGAADTDAAFRVAMASSLRLRFVQSVDRLRRRHMKEGAKLRFMSAVEFGEKNDRPHLHALLCEASPVWITRDEIRASWRRGFVDFQAIRLDDGTGLLKAARYVSKYVTKAGGRPSASPGWGDPYAAPFALRTAAAELIAARLGGAVDPVALAEKGASLRPFEFDVLDDSIWNVHDESDVDWVALADRLMRDQRES